MGWFDILALLANLGSLVGFALTLYVYHRVRKLREHYALIGRVPVAAEQLRLLASALRRQVRVGAERPEVLKTLSEAKAALESIARNIGGEHGRAYVKLRDQIDNTLRERELDREKLYRIYGGLTLLAKRAIDVVEDRKHRLSP